MKWLLPFGIFLLVSCQSTSGGFCDLSKPIRLTPEQIERLSDEQVKELLGHNRRGQEFCGWSP